MKTNKSSQENRKSLKNLFGGNLTETGKADLERAGKCAAQELAKVIFSKPVVSKGV